MKVVPKNKKESSMKYQYLATVAVNLLVIGLGIGIGWCSPNILLLTSGNSPLPTGQISMEEASWIASLLCIGGLAGNFFFAFITNAFGRKLPLIFIIIPKIIGWLLNLNAQNVYYLYAARLIIGFVGSGIFVVVPLYLNEIASDSVRGVLGSTVILSYNIGIEIAYILGKYTDYETTPKVVFGLTVAYAIAHYFLPETPMFLIKQNKIDETEKSIRFYQNRRAEQTDRDLIHYEIDKLRRTGGSKTESENGFRWLDLVKNPGRKAMIIGIVLFSINQMCGCFAMLNYTANIFKEAGSSLSPNVSAIIVGAIQLIGSCVGTSLVDRAGRKILYAISTIGTALGLIVLGAYMMLKQMNFDVDPYNWIPIVSFSSVISIASLGILNLYSVVLSEVMPEKLKNFGISVCMVFIWVLSFLIVKLLPLMNETFGFHGTMFFFAGCCITTAIFIIAFMPETKGKSYEEIMILLSK